LQKSRKLNSDIENNPLKPEEKKTRKFISHHRPRTANNLSKAYRDRRKNGGKRDKVTSLENDYEFKETETSEIVKQYQNASITTPQMEYNHYESKQFNLLALGNNLMNAHYKERRKYYQKSYKRFNEVEGSCKFLIS